MTTTMGWAGFGGAGESQHRCSFCGRRLADVGHLVRARGTSICERCTTQAYEAIRSAPPTPKLLRIRPEPVRPPDRDAAEREIEHAYETVFASELPVPERCRALEDGEALEPVMADVHRLFAPARTLDVVVDAVRFISEHEAEVDFTILVPQITPTGQRQKGHALRIDDTWKVSRDTWCGLVRLTGVVCPPRPA